MDPNQISQCMPDLQSLEVRSPDDYTAVVRAGVSFIKGDFSLRFTVVDRNPPAHARLMARGTGMGSTVDMETAVDLTESPNGGTTMKWAADAKVGGKLASLGQRLLDGQSEKIIRQLFSSLQQKLEST